MTRQLIFAVLAAVCATSAAGLVGGFSQVNVTDDGVQNALKFAVAQHNRGTNSMYLSQVKDVVEAKSQIVAGVNYVITVNLVRTNCTKDHVNEVCTEHLDPELAHSYNCTFKIWTKVWQNFIKVTNEKC